MIERTSTTIDVSSVQLGRYKASLRSTNKGPSELYLVREGTGYPDEIKFVTFTSEDVTKLFSLLQGEFV